MPAKPIAVVASDLHLQDRAWAQRPIEGDSYFAFQQIVDLTLKHNLEALILAGDTFDRRENRPRPIIEFSKQAERIHKRKKRILYVEGQHEMDDSPWLSGYSCCEHLHRNHVRISGVDIVGLNYLAGDALRSALEEPWPPKDTDVLVTHQLWSEFMGKYADVSLEEVPNARLVITGDFHETHSRIINREGSPFRVLSPGSTCQQDISEDPQKYAFILYDDLSLKSVKLRGRRLHRATITTQEEAESVIYNLAGILDQLWEQSVELRLPDAVAQPLLSLAVSANLPNVEQRVRDLMSNRSRPSAHLFWKVLPVPRPHSAATAKAKRFERGGLRAMLGLQVKKSEQPELYRFCEQALAGVEGGRPAGEVLAELKQKYLYSQEVEA